jgi:transcriptional regulator with XRE-family HTH domain
MDQGPASVTSVPYRSAREATIRRRAQIGERLRAIRKDQRLSQRTLGDQVGIDPRSISAIENGRSGITLDALIDIADALGVPLTQLLADD